jgi:transposase
LIAPLRWWLGAVWGGRGVLPFFATVEPCRIGIEACASRHYWARELGALGHDVRLMAPRYVKPY